MKIIFCYICILLIFQVNSKLPDEKRKELFDLYAKKLSLDNADDLYLEADPTGIRYDKSKIDELIKKYNFPSSYNFIEDKGAPVHIKNQGKCGCCWAMSSTTVMAYRFFLKGYTLDLSPQHELSCYMKNCNGNNLIDPFLSLTINGTLTEECLPFTSGARIIEECPSKCKDPNIEYKKYYAKNAYTIKIDKDNIYNVTAIIMDQLITNGPVMTSIEAYVDLYELAYKSNCSDIVYVYDGKSSFQGGHAITIVGYGYLDDKYYWLIQNSWGTSYCDKGFIKVEFGQIGIEQVSFAEPYLPNKESTPDEVDLTFDSLADDCKLNIKPPNFDFNNSFEVNFEKVNNNDDIKENPYIFKYICGKFKDQNDKDSLNCYFEDLKYPPIGKYQFKNLSTLGTENIFTDISGTFNGKSFDFFSWDLLYPLYNNTQVFFVSEKGSGIIFTYEYSGNDNITSYIYPSASNDKNLKNCKIIKFSNVKFVYCELDNDEIEYFNYPNQASDNPIVYKSHCGKMNSHTIVYKINKNENPVFKIIRAYTKRSKTVNPNTEIKLVAKVEGSISGFNKIQNFVVFGEIVEEKTNDVIFLCKLTKPENTGIEHEIICTPNIKEGDFIFYNINIYPYVIPRDFDIPYEIFISENIKVKETFSKYLKNSILLILSLLTFL